mgnify:CR=1 FL=1
MDYTLVWKTLTVFNFAFFLVWVSFYTYRADFFKDEDFIDKDKGVRGSGNPKSDPDSPLSHSGRTLIFLISLIFSLVISIFFFYIFIKYYKPTFKCKKGAKNLKDCKLIK